MPHFRGRQDAMQNAGVDFPGWGFFSPIFRRDETAGRRKIETWPGTFISLHFCFFLTVAAKVTHRRHAVFAGGLASLYLNVKILQINFDFHLHFADEHTLATWLTRQSGQANTAGKMKMKTKRAKENKAKTKTAQSKKKKYAGRKL